MTEMVEKVARAIAEGLGDNFDHAFIDKGEWNASRGEKGGRYRDINEPRQYDYIDAARAAVEALREPTEAMVAAGMDANDDYREALEDSRASLGPTGVYRAMINAALSPETGTAGG